jgi:hypothetical protein
MDNLDQYVTGTLGIIMGFFVILANRNIAQRISNFNKTVLKMGITSYFFLRIFIVILGLACIALGVSLLIFRIFIK